MRLAKIMNPSVYEAFRIYDIAEGVDLDLLVYYSVTGRGVVLRGFDIRGDDILSDQMRSINVGEIRSAISEELMAYPERYSAVALAAHLGNWTGDPEIARRAIEAATEAVAILRQLPRDRRRTTTDVSDDRYRATALMYIEFVRRYDRTAVKEMSIAISAPRQTIYWWIKRAREQGWLARGTKGTVEATPGPRLVEWLEKEGTQ